jgi:uncharacterized protein (TIGR02231 family)
MVTGLQRPWEHGKTRDPTWCNALIHQVSGEDWNAVQLALSTASPSVSAYNPRLTPLYVNVGAGIQTPSAEQAQNYDRAQTQRKEAIVGQGQVGSISAAAIANFDANTSAASVQLIELSERLSELRRLSDANGGEELSIQYALEAPLTLVSRREGQTVPVLRHTTSANFYHVATPVLTAAVFREAELSNSSGFDLLGGRVNIYLDGEFTGRTDIPSIARGQNLALGFGVDGQLRARRTVADRRDSVQGGNRQVTVTGEIVLDNFKTTPVTVQVRERTPFNEDSASLRVSIGEMSHPLSEDPDYLRFQKPKGVLLWDLSVNPGTGDTVTTLRYSYSLEFDKNLTLQDISNEQKSRLREEFLNETRRAALKGKESIKWKK